MRGKAHSLRLERSLGKHSGSSSMPVAAKKRRWKLSTGLPRIGPYSSMFTRGVLGGCLDGRSREAKYLRAVEAQLVAHIGGHPSAAQVLLIRRAAQTSLRLSLFDKRLAGGVEWTERDARESHALSNQLRLLLREIGLRAAAPKAPSLAEIIAEHDAEKAASISSPEAAA